MASPLPRGRYRVEYLRLCNSDISVTRSIAKTLAAIQFEQRLVVLHPHGSHDAFDSGR